MNDYVTVELYIFESIDK